MIVNGVHKEIGSFIELQLSHNMEYYKGNVDIARLNSGRAAIWHAVRILNVNTVWLPLYQCDTVRDFLTKKKVNLKYYHMDCNFNPVDLDCKHEEAVLFVNYYGIMSTSRMEQLSKVYDNVIIDNSQAFFSEPVTNAMNIYSARKFVGVPDGAYVVGKQAELLTENYQQGYSSDTALFLLQRIEYGCEGKTYESRMINEKRINNEDVRNMSRLTHSILDGTDYETIKNARIENFRYAHSLLGQFNKLDPLRYLDKSCVPMVYPLVIEEEDLIEKLLIQKHFQGHWWSYLLDEVEQDCFEYWLSKYIIPITIDQRYTSDDIDAINSIIMQ